MHHPAANRSRKWFTLRTSACFSVLVGILISASTGSGQGERLAAHGQTPTAPPGAPSAGGTSSLDEMRALVRELETQAQGQLDQLEKTRSSLRRARAILTDLERVQQPPEARSPDRSSKHTRNPNDPMQRETLSQQALADKTPWSWPLETGTPEACARHFGGGYDVETKVPDVPSLPPMVEVRKDGNTIVSWRAQIASVFLRGADTLYYAEFSPYSSGCSVVAYDLNRGERWKTPLWGIGPLGNSMYANRVNMKLEGNHLIVYGDESAGRYIQLIDVRTGRIVGRRGGAGQRLLR